MLIYINKMATAIIALLMEGLEMLGSGVIASGVEAGAETAGGAMLEAGLPSDIVETLAGTTARGVATTAGGIGLGTGLGLLGDKIIKAIDEKDTKHPARDKREMLNRINKMKLAQQKELIADFLKRLGNRNRNINVLRTTPLIPLQQSNSLFTSGPIPHIPPNPTLIWPEKIAEIRSINTITQRNPNPAFGQTVWRGNAKSVWKRNVK